RAAERQRAVLLALHLDQRVEHHRAAFFGVDLERVEAGILATVGVVTIDFEFLDRSRALRLVDFSALLRTAVLGQAKFGHMKGSLMQLRVGLDPINRNDKGVKDAKARKPLA